MLCPECETEMVFGAHVIVTSVGGHAVECRSLSHERCPSCGYYKGRLVIAVKEKQKKASE